MRGVLLAVLPAVSLAACGVNLPTAANEPTKRVFRSDPVSLTDSTAIPTLQGRGTTLRAGSLSATHTDSFPTGGSQVTPGFNQQSAPLTDVNSYPTIGTGVQAYGTGSRLPQ